MKKFLFIVMAVFAMSFCACGNKVTPASNSNDTTDTTIDSIDSDSVYVLSSPTE